MCIISGHRCEDSGRTYKSRFIRANVGNVRSITVVEISELNYMYYGIREYSIILSPRFFLSKLMSDITLSGHDLNTSEGIILVYYARTLDC